MSMTLKEILARKVLKEILVRKVLKEILARERIKNKHNCIDFL